MLSTNKIKWVLLYCLTVCPRSPSYTHDKKMGKTSETYGINGFEQIIMITFLMFEQQYNHIRETNKGNLSKIPYVLNLAVF